MRTATPLLLILSLSTLLAACEPAQPPATPATPPTSAAAPTSTTPQTVTPPGPTAPPAAACPGKVEPVDGLAEVADEALVKQALGDPGKGSLCTGKAFQAVKAVTVYRVWDKSKAYTQLGRWWSFARPAGPRDVYRVANEICTEWSPLDVVSECHLKAGTHIVVGPGQSATCQSGSFPASPTNQVYVPNDTKDPANQKLYVDGCTPGAAWP